MRLGLAVLLAAVFFALGSGGEPGYPIYIQPGLVPRLGPSQVVPPRLPFHTSMGRVSATIEDIERIALVTADNLPSVHPSLRRGPAERQVWAVLFRGQVRANLPGYEIEARPITRGAYLVADESGAWTSLGGLPPEPSR